jgi:hypothetical protein
MSGAGEYDHFEISWFAPIFVGIGVARCFSMYPVIYFFNFMFVVLSPEFDC